MMEIGGFAAACALMPATASAATIGFDNLGEGEVVNAQYASQGVTFEGTSVKAFTYPAGFARSAPAGIETCVAAEFCFDASIAVDFTTAQTKVGIWVGYDGPLQTQNPLDVRLTAFNGNGSEVGHDDVSLQSERGLAADR